MVVRLLPVEVSEAGLIGDPGPIETEDFLNEIFTKSFIFRDFFLRGEFNRGFSLGVSMPDRSLLCLQNFLRA